jgi:predicted phage tail protein
MLKKAMLLIFSGMLMMNLTGCFLFIAGVAGGAGTAVWLSGKLTQEFHASYHSTVDATKSALQALNLPVVKETHDENITQIKGTYSDGREMWIDIHRVTDDSTKVEVRIGGVSSDKEADSIVLKKIQDLLY